MNSLSSLARRWCLILTGALLGMATLAQAESPQVAWITVEDVIGPVSAGYIAEALHQSADSKADLVVIALDTPGGLDSAMRAIIKQILASPVPVCVYISPEGARAASAGVYIAYSAHVAAMAPGTNLGSATPVSLGGGEMDTTMVKKVKNDAVAYIRGLARLRGRNEDWAVRAVQEAVSLPSSDAAAQNVVDFVAADRADLLGQISGRTVVVNGDSTTLGDFRSAVVTEVRRSLRYRLLAALNNPNVAYMLLILGFYGLFFELSNPGAIAPGVLGGIFLILGLFALHSLSLNYAGLLLMIFGIALFLLEIKITSHGVLAIGGTVALLAGSIMLIDSPLPYLRVSLKVIIPAVGVTAAFFLFAVSLGLRAQRRRQIAGAEGMIGQVGTARTALSPTGTVFVSGEHWTARAESGATISEGARIEVVQLNHLTLTVREAVAESEGERP